MTARLLQTALLFLILGSSFGIRDAFSQEKSSAKPSKYLITKNRDNFVGWLAAMREAIESSYFDRNYKGIDIDAKFDAAKARIGTLDYDWQMLRVLVQVAMDFDDSHTRIYPPKPLFHYDYGFTMQIVGNECLITSVRPDSDAARKGLEVGDRILRVGKFEPTRDNLWQIRYVISTLDPTDTIELSVGKRSGSTQTVKVTASSTPYPEYVKKREKEYSKRRETAFRCSELSPDTIACKLYSFSVSKGDVDRMFKAIGSHNKLILDLRGNGGGLVETEEYLVGRFFDRSVKIADVKTRKKIEPRMSKGRGADAYRGNLVVLVDSESASASEIFARVIQLEKRGKVLGDVTSGSVMTSILIPIHKVDVQGFNETPYPLAMNLTVGDVIMSDGGRLEDSGVVPDIPIVPADAALAKGEDPVLAVAAAIHGVKLSPESAGHIGFLFDRDNDGS